MPDRRRIFGVVTLTVSMVLISTLPSAADIGTIADDDALEVAGWDSRSVGDSTPSGSADGGHSQPVATGGAIPPPPACNNIGYTPAAENSYYVDLNGCLHEGAAQIGREFLVTMPAEPGEPAEEAPAAVPIVVTAEDLQRLPIDPGGLAVQPDRGWVLVNLETIVWTGAAEQTFSAVVLGTPVEVRARPIDFTWDFGDGSAPITTTDPGAPFPNHSVAHVYSAAAEQRQVTLTTRWAGEFEVNGSGVWQPVAGVATTSEVSEPFEVRTAETSLTNG
ncbi:hypothetical protein KZX45_15585 [Georgenia sp. EYE_87]|uniref:hypothetical protein n=1 Tax=Georgenia sp. EYE_87 TaxID=2853448 RepID=UPI002006D313|nr:hypothetical protein [Georgenia sp. EYE_87]MCK6211967.1 hypothetical protein [Georgenia sp. EYE_87]